MQSALHQRVQCHREYHPHAGERAHHPITVYAECRIKWTHTKRSKTGTQARGQGPIHGLCRECMFVSGQAGNQLDRGKVCRCETERMQGLQPKQAVRVNVVAASVMRQPALYDQGSQPF